MKTLNQNFVSLPASDEVEAGSAGVQNIPYIADWLEWSGVKLPPLTSRLLQYNMC